MSYRRAVIWLLMFILYAALASPALAKKGDRPDARIPMPQLANSEHFLVHAVADYPSDDLPTILANAERVYTTETGWGFLPPLDDGDGKIDLYVHPFTHPGEQRLGGRAGRAKLPGGTPHSTPGYISFNSAKGRIGPKLSLIGHEFFHLLFFRIGAIGSNRFPSEALADWAGHKVIGKFPKRKLLEGFERPLDCTEGCKEAYAYKRSIFFTFLDAKHGTPIIKELLDRAAAQPQNVTEAISQTVSSHGKSLEQAYADFSDYLLRTAFTAGKRGVHQTVSAKIYTGQTSGAYRERSFTLSHLSSKYILLKGGRRGISSGRCHNAQLLLSVTGDPVRSVAPGLFLGKPKPLQRLSVSGSTATTKVPWSTCHSSRAMLSLPNVSRTADDQRLTVRMRLVR